MSLRNLGRIRTIPRLPDGGAGRLDGSSEPARLTEGVWLVEWKQLKDTNDTPFAAARHFPQGGQRGPVQIRLGAFRLVFCVPRLTPPAHECEPPQLCMKRLYAALWSATPAKPFRGGWKVREEKDRRTRRRGCGGEGEWRKFDYSRVAKCLMVRHIWET